MKSNILWKLSVLFYLGLVSSFIIYSFSQIDLNLTLWTNSTYQTVQTSLIDLGYYNRILSVIIFSVLISSLYVIYGLSLMFVKHLGKKHTWILICLASFLFLAYPAFSHDLFNYIFDARIVTHYNLSPYYFKALDFPADLWIRFMHWTHRYYPYGPIWILITLAPSIAGIQKFTFTLLLFKIFFLTFYIVNCYLVWKISEKIIPEKSKFALIFFALNPLVLIESLVSPHNESVMLTFVLLALYTYISRPALSFFFLVMSIGIKYVSIILLPLLNYYKRINQKFFIYLFIGWFIILVPFIIQRETYPWYFVPLVAWAALSTSSKLCILTLAVSIALISRYIPNIGGIYGHQAAVYQNLLMVSIFIITSLAGFWIWKNSSKFKLTKSNWI